jgi:hypothetical protein
MAGLLVKLFTRKDGQDGQYDEHCDLIGKGDGQEIVRCAYNQCSQANPHQISAPRNPFGEY